MCVHGVCVCVCARVCEKCVRVCVCRWHTQLYLTIVTICTQTYHAPIKILRLTINVQLKALLQKAVRATTGGLRVKIRKITRTT